MNDEPGTNDRLQQIDDEISILLDEWWEHDQHFDSDRLHRVGELRKEREVIMENIV